jgi:vancomycin resistance protein YoaR
LIEDSLMYSRGVRIAVLPVVILAMLAGVGFSFLSGDTIYQGVRVSNVEMGGMTSKQAESRLASVVSDVSDQRVVLRYTDQTFDTTFGEIGGRVDIPTSVRAAYHVGRDGNVFTRVADVLSVRRNGKQIPVAYSFNKEAASEFLRTAASKIDRRPVDATVVIQGESISMTPETPGIKLDIKRSMDRLTQAANSGTRDIRLVVVTAEPKVKEADLRGIEGVIASYSTVYKTSQRDRTHNLRIACRAINGTLVMPGEDFSYNKEVGPREKANGFRDALMFVDGQVEPGTGGGVCQVSTTLYNAALLADMKIVRRQHHSRPVAYAPVGRDATVAYPALDFRFRNTSDSPVYIAASVGSHTVNVSILGAKSAGKEVELVSSGHQVIAAPDTRRVIIDPKLTETVVKERGHAGHRVSIYRVVKLDGEVVKRELISNDYYSPQGRIVAMPKPAEATEPTPATKSSGGT